MSSTLGEPPHREWFESFEQQEHASRFGMWLFIGSETLLFAGLFALYVAYRLMHPEAFAEAAAHNNALLGTANTLVLITSSFTMAWSIHALRRGSRLTSLSALIVTAGLGGVFLLLKLWEYAEHVHEQILPGAYYAYEAMPGAGSRLFFTLYYFMTGLHALHLVGGIATILVLAELVRRGKITRERHNALENGGLYWHLIDVVWIFLWPLLYLVG